MRINHWTDDPALDAAVERLRNLLAERGCYCAFLSVGRGRPSLQLHGEGRGTGTPSWRTSDGPCWMSVGDDGITTVVQDQGEADALAAATVRAERAEDQLRTVIAGLHTAPAASSNTPTMEVPAGTL